jgi:hypothetical protein
LLNRLDRFGSANDPKRTFVIALQNVYDASGSRCCPFGTSWGKFHRPIKGPPSDGAKSKTGTYVLPMLRILLRFAPFALAPGFEGCVIGEISCAYAAIIGVSHTPAARR